MQRLCGFIEKGYRFEVKVPTTIFDEKMGIISAYRGQRCVDRIYFPLRRMPRWDVPLQAILLGKYDEKTLERRTEQILERLPELESR